MRHCGEQGRCRGWSYPQRQRHLLGIRQLVLPNPATRAAAPALSDGTGPWKLGQT
eukprot:CAMPEP_0114138766 /NCGR_PEP_ID=MMETSP0043_2-20121206/16504_1 /TAXON_ID=464988 /ORGANISM="Hemiselmis andersenii, Strain CCMP644" /LENGTH=54 /DNA_ID=CAMNT_0001232771 /DNA_START=551 /DNA_END=711 /DNA_ORIENTATION=-